MVAFRFETLLSAIHDPKEIEQFKYQSYLKFLRQ